MIPFLFSHSTAIMIAAWVVFSNAVSALPTPVESSGPKYRYFYRFLNGLAQNLSVFEPKPKI